MKSLPATIELEDGRLSIASGETEIGSWDLADIHLEATPTGYRMAAEGDQILIEFEDIDSFTEELERGNKRRLIKRGRKSEDRKPSEVAAAPIETPVRTATPAEPRPGRNVALPPAESSPEPKRKKQKKQRQAPTESQPTSTGVLDFVDGVLVKAQKRFGPYLPDWVFTRIVFAGLIAALVLVIVLPGLISVLLLVGGLLLVLFGAVVYTDPMLASRLLPGRTAPQHALLFGVLTLMVGVLLGVIAR
ncbi:MAG: hypothetical protein WCE80_01295 [Acidimicrobiia bacterium]